jgi:hypothetical protein
VSVSETLVFLKPWPIHYRYSLLAGKFVHYFLWRNSIVDVGILYPGRTPDLAIFPKDQPYHTYFIITNLRYHVKVVKTTSETRLLASKVKMIELKINGD